MGSTVLSFVAKKTGLGPGIISRLEHAPPDVVVRDISNSCDAVKSLFSNTTAGDEEFWLFVLLIGIGAAMFV
ncbi:hypothetical protein EBT16_15310 [bacterium]|nr:hypothetical protein [bacterium]